jgi:hypothetical protein
MKVARTVLLLIFGVLSACSGGSDKKNRPPDQDADGIADSADCAPADPSRSQRMMYQSIDRDGDSFRINEAGELCVGQPPPTNVSSQPVAANQVDCDDTNAQRWQVLSYASRDLDADGRKLIEAGSVCSGTTLRVGYFAGTEGAQPEDCDDADDQCWRRAATYADADSDGVGAGTAITSCIGRGAPGGRSLYGYDPIDNPSDPNAARVSNFDIDPALLTPIGD